MPPLLPFSLKASPSPPTPSTESSLAASFTFASSGSLSSPAPKTPPNSLLLDLSPQSATSAWTSSSHNAYGQSASSSCAYPSWPNRPSLVSTDSSCTTATSASTCSTTSNSSAYISDEELLDTTPLSSPAIELDQDPYAAVGANILEGSTLGSISMSAKQRIRDMREETDEQEARARFLAQVQAHARAQHLATRVQQGVPQPLQQQQQQPQNATLASRPTKQRKPIVPVVGKKRRATSSSSKKGYPRV